MTLDEKKLRVETLQKEYEFQLNKAIPSTNTANSAINSLKKDDITELKGLAKPSASCVIVI